MTLIPQYNSTKNDHPFGMLMPGRSYSSTAYKYGFNGKEKDDEVSGTGNQYDYGFRIYNPRIGKFLSVDPLTESYPWLTPYQFAENCPIQFIDIDGLESGWNLSSIGATLTMQTGDIGNVYRKPVIITTKPAPKLTVPEQSFVQGGIQGTEGFKIAVERVKVGYEISKYAPGTSDIHDGKDVLNNFLAGNYKAAAFSALFFIPGSDFFKLAKFIPLNSWGKYGVQSYDEFRKVTSKLPERDRIAKFYEAGRDVAKNNGWEKSNKLSKINDREVYEVFDSKGKIESYRALDTEKGTFEVLNKKGRHQGEANFDGNGVSGADESGKHDIKFE
jgi:RHS repeat-associated protein